MYWRHFSFYVTFHFTETCQVESRNNNNITCYVVEGKLTVFYPNTLNSTKLNEEQSKILNIIKTIMDDNKLQNYHPAIINVKFRGKSNNIRLENGDHDNSIHFITSLAVSDQLIWIVTIVSLLILLPMIVITRYRYYSKHTMFCVVGFPTD